METKDKRVKFLARLRKREGSNTSDHTWNGRQSEGQYRNRKDGMRLWSLSTNQFADPDDMDKFLGSRPRTWVMKKEKTQTGQKIANEIEYLVRRTQD